MGIPDLWKVLEDARERHSLRTLTIQEGFEGARRDRLYRIGVDASIWMRQMQQTFAVGHAQSGENPELRTVFYRLAMLSERPVHLIFVADGPMRPAKKRGRQVKTTPHWLTEGMQRLVEGFGFTWFEASGEAEADLARMNDLGFVDAVMTDDSDVLLFGARVVLRSPCFKRASADTVEVYRRSSILNKLSLSRGDLILYGLLVGCDYNTGGLKKCGRRIASGILKYDLGAPLYAAFITHTGDDLAGFLVRWRRRLQDVLRNDPRGVIGRTYPALASSITATFPDLDIIRLFVNPSVRTAADYMAIGEPSPIDVERIAGLCELYFTWGTRSEILKTLRTTLWSSVTVRMLIKAGTEEAEVDTEVRQRTCS
ncbi:PIN domain-like protein [Lenzites betulinus]|nr:PIN domain-like protein [Lenzites betulinus]